MHPDAPNSELSKIWVCHALSRRAKNGPKSDIFGTPRARLLSRSTSTRLGGVPSQMGRWMTVLDFVADDEFDVLAEIRRSRPVWGFDVHNPNFHFFDHPQILYRYICMCLQTTCRFASVTLLSRSVTLCHAPVTLCHPARPPAFT